MLCRYLNFYLSDKGLSIYLSRALCSHQRYFRSAVTLFNHSTGRHASCEKGVILLAMANRPHQFCQLLIEGNDAELAHMVLFALISEHCLVLPPTQDTQASLASAMNAKVRVHSFPNSPAINKNLILSKISQGSYPSEHIDLFEHREALSVTLMGEMIALPHIISEHITQPEITIINLKSPIDWGSPRSDVQCIVSLILPKSADKNYYRQFAWIARAFTQPIYCRLFLHAPTHIKPLMLAVCATRSALAD